MNYEEFENLTYTDLVQVAEETGRGAFIRMSEAGDCHLKIGYKMLDLKAAPQDEIAMRMGSALEPMVVQWLEDQGIYTLFAGQDQLELARADPYMTGHPDGISHVPYGEISSWASRHIPMSVQDAFARGESVLLEVKTMGPQRWNSLKNEGLENSSDPFLHKYLVQSRRYLDTINDRSNDEVWDARSMDLVLGNLPRPTICLVVGLNTNIKTANSAFAFDVVQHVPDYVKELDEALYQGVIAPMRAGGLPIPSHPNGDAAECYWCPYSGICPAVQSKKEALLSIDSLADIEIEDDSNFDVELFDTLAAQDIDLKADIAALEEDRKKVRERMEALIPAGSKRRSERFRASYSLVSGRKTIDQDALKQMAEELGFTIPYKTGAGHTRMRIDPLFGPNVER